MPRLTATNIGTAAAVAAGVIPFIIYWLGRRDQVRLNRDQLVKRPPQPRERLAMIRRGRDKWIAGVLEPSLAQAARLALGLEHRPDTLDLGSRTRRSPARPPQPLPPDTPISQVFDQMGGRLLILGAPGAGKTTLLLQLAAALLDRAEADPTQPIPVVVNLASWARRRQPLAAWLADELAVSYDIPAQKARAWVDADELALLLDGLDEVASAHRAACVVAINAWRREHGLVPLVVCSRTQELQALGTALRLEEAVELQPPTDAQITAYLDQLEASGTPLAEVRAALDSDQELRALLRSPLLLHVVALAYQGRTATALRAPGTLAQRQGRLWSAYVSRMFEQRPLEPGGYTEQQAVGWLAWLARRLGERDQTEFHLDRLDPGWLPTQTQQREVRDAVELAAGLLVGLVTGLSFALTEGLDWGWWAGVISGGLAALIVRGAGRQAPVEELHWTRGALVVGWGGGLLGGLLGGLSSGDPVGGTQGLGVAYSLVYGLSNGLPFGLLFGLAGRLVGSRTRRIAPTRMPRLSLGGLAVGLLGGLMFGVLTGGSYGLVGGVAYGLTYGLAFGLIFGMVAGVRAERITPNEGIRRAARHALVAGLAVLLAFRLIDLAVGNFLRLGALPLELPAGLLVGLVFGGGTWLHHYGVRAGLAHTRAAPWRYGWFLDAMADRLLLRRSGSAYLFVHRLLRDHLAELDRTPAAATDAVGGR
jgi:eukaryotic-like serine/threonine-protein kinase